MVLWIIVLLLVGMIVGATWLVGFWNNVLTLVCVILAALVATSFFEPVATWLNSVALESTFLVDFVALWLLFFVAFGVLRLMTDILSKHRSRFDRATEIVGCTLTSISIACVFVSFAFFTLHTAALPVTGPVAEAFQPTPDAYNLGVGPDRMWMSFVKQASRGSLSADREDPLLATYEIPTTNEPDVRVFDPNDEYMARYRQRRKLLSERNALQVYVD